MLSGVTILDLSQQLPGPYATMLLRHLGARVIKLEPPGSDPARVIDPWMFSVLNAGKECLTLNLYVLSGRKVMDRLLARADALLEGFRPGVAARLGIGYAQVAWRHPRLVYCSISGYGQSGPYRDLPGHDLNYLGAGGGVGGSGPPAELPAEGAPVGIPLVDLAAGSTAALTLLAALREREHTGRGRWLDVAMLDQAVFWSCIKAGWMLGAPPCASPPEGEPTYGCFRAADGRFLTISVMEDKFWRMLCQALGWDDWLAEPELATYAGRKQRAGEVLQRLRAHIATAPRDVWLAKLAAARLPVAPVHAYTEVPGDPQVRQRQLFQEGPADQLRMRPPLPRDCWDPGVQQAPGPDEHRQVILTELGYGPVEQEALAAAGAFGPAGGAGQGEAGQPSPG